MICEVCGEEEWLIDCKACGEHESWCQNCQDACYFDPDNELCSVCFERAEAETEVARAEYARTVDIKVTVLDVSEETLISMAVENAVIQKMDYLGRAEMRGDLRTKPDDFEYKGSESRAVTNFLRHHATNYDNILERLPKLRREHNDLIEIQDDAYETIRERVHEAIQRAYPSLVLSFD